MQRKPLTLTNSPHVRLAVRVLGAILLLFVGADHYYEYSVDQYSVVPTIGTLFLLNFISASAIGLILLAPLDRVRHRHGLLALKLAALAGFGVAATSLAALLVSEQTKLFGFMESNYRPAILVAIASEAVAAILMALLLVLTVVSERSTSKRGLAPGGRPRLKLSEARSAEPIADGSGYAASRRLGLRGLGPREHDLQHRADRRSGGRTVREMKGHLERRRERHER